MRAFFQKFEKGKIQEDPNVEIEQQ